MEKSEISLLFNMFFYYNVERNMLLKEIFHFLFQGGNLLCNKINFQKSQRF
jgi:hypothetical protein